MKITLTSANSIDVESALVSLCELRPLINGKVIEPGEIRIIQTDPSDLVLQMTLPSPANSLFSIRAIQRDESRAEMFYWLKDVPADITLDSFGIRFERIENLRAYLRNGYTSWDGSFYVEPGALSDFEAYEERPELGYAMTQLLPRIGNGCLVLGFERHDRFQQTFMFDTRQTPPGLKIETLWDRKEPASSPASERLVIFEHGGIEEALREWARIVARASPHPPRLSARIIGWCSWYNLYAYINEENVLSHLRSVCKIATQEQLPMRVFQIDDGFTPEMGDWLDVKPQFPRGMKPLLDEVRAAGFIPGLWIAPFMVGNRSRLFCEHPDWLVRERSTGAPLVHWKFYGEFRWHKRSEEYYVLDTTLPEAFEYLRRVFRTWRREWGCEYFKTDFMFWGAEYGPDRAVWHRSGMTRIEIWRRVGEMIREEIGDAVWVGSGCPLWASVGLVDANRIGTDIGVEWRGHLSAQSLLRDGATHNFANHILWQMDPDCILLRERFHHLSDAELRSLAIYAGMTGGVAMTSDVLDELSSDRLRLWKLVLNEKIASSRFPFLGQSALRYERVADPRDSHRVRREARMQDPVLVQVRGDGDVQAIFIFNTGETQVQRTYRLSDLGMVSPRFLFDWSNDRAEDSATDQISVVLESHDSVLFFASPSPITVRPEQLP